MKKNYYGNIEDIVQNIKIVTPLVFSEILYKNREHLKNKVIGLEYRMDQIYSML